ncbi:S-formylglutathione hydrolase [Novosphingopyxis sp.]|uniref:S-formylglutathione hydrolase n=1 Tax=Novosphingopyxis sp. TaxID=2709690 RepID=UPI003B5CF04E
MKILSTNASHGGDQGVYRHASDSTGTDMTFSVFVPPHEAGVELPVLWYLSGLSCTHANVTEKGEYRAACADEGIIFIAPDTSPRGKDVPDEEGYDLGKGAGFYLDATEEPWAAHYRMRSYIEDELPALIAAEFPMADMSRQSITGHSMGGHGALTIGLRGGERFRSVSAFSPVVAPMQVPWGEKAFSKYLGEDRAAWRQHDACAMIADGARVPELLVEQGAADQFLDEQLKPELLREACEKAGIALALNMREGYDHSYYFISTFLGDHVRWHAERLKR